MKYEKWSFGYSLFRIYVKLAYRLVHKNITVTGRENIPKHKPVIFAPNHQNALCDPLAIVCHVRRQPVWLARADIFKHKIARTILRFFKIMPVYRLRDGKQNLGKNDLTFSGSVTVLANNGTLGLFPEAAHSGKRQMLPHKKAIPRIAFMAEEITRCSLDIQIIPVGIYYSHYWKFDRSLIVHFGPPIPVKEFITENQQTTLEVTLGLRDRIYQSILPLVIQINSKNYYQEFEWIREMYTLRLLERKGEKPSRLNEFRAGQIIVAKLDELEQTNPGETEKLCDQVAEYKALIQKLKIRDWVVDQKQCTRKSLVTKAIILILGLPFFIYGGLLNIAPFLLIDRVVRKNVKDITFWSTFFFPLGLVLFPLFYLGEMILLSGFLPGIIPMIAFLVSFPITGKIAFRWFILFRKTVGLIRFYMLNKKHKQRFLHLFRIKKQILKNVDAIIPGKG
jgi:1-acyl-sn-glycerol-3-phosphate acyltransferase